MRPDHRVMVVGSGRTLCPPSRRGPAEREAEEKQTQTKRAVSNTATETPLVVLKRLVLLVGLVNVSSVNGENVFAMGEMLKWETMPSLVRCVR